MLIFASTTAQSFCDLTETLSEQLTNGYLSLKWAAINYLYSIECIARHAALKLLLEKASTLK